MEFSMPGHQKKRLLNMRVLSGKEIYEKLIHKKNKDSSERVNKSVIYFYVHWKNITKTDL